MSSASSASSVKTDEIPGTAAKSSSSRFAQFQSSFYRKTSFAPKIKKKKEGAAAPTAVVRPKDKETSAAADAEKDIER